MALARDCHYASAHEMPICGSRLRPASRYFELCNDMGALTGGSDDSMRLAEYFFLRHGVLEC